MESTNPTRDTTIVLMADDDEDDRYLTEAAFKKNKLQNPLHFVNNGQELIDYLYRRGKFANLFNTPLPGIILLDLNMPVKDGKEALKEIKSEPKFKSIPIIILTTSQSEEDVKETYNMGANSFVVKPSNFEGLTKVCKELGKYWFEVVQLKQPRSI